MCFYALIKGDKRICHSSSIQQDDQIFLIFESMCEQKNPEESAGIKLWQSTSILQSAEFKPVRSSRATHSPQLAILKQLVQLSFPECGRLAGSQIPCGESQKNTRWGLSKKYQVHLEKFAWLTGCILEKQQPLAATGWDIHMPRIQART